MRWRAFAVAGLLVAGCGGDGAPSQPALRAAAGPANAPQGIAAEIDRTGAHRERLAARDHRRGARLRGLVFSAAPSPDRRRVALGVALRGRVQILDAARPRHRALVETTAGTPLLEVAWPAAGRVLAVSGGDPGVEGVLVDLDPRTATVRRERDLDGAAVAAHGGPLGLTAVIAPVGDIAEARLLHVDARGRPRAWPLPGVAAGAATDTTGDLRLRERVPALAVSEADARAFVVAPGRGLRIVEVDLRTGRALTHEVRPPRRSVAGMVRGLLDGLVDEAHAKAGERAWRQAHWLGDGRLAVTGVDESFDHAVGEQRAVPVGLRIVDVRAWTQRVVDRRATYLVPAGDGVATGDGVGDRFGVRFEGSRTARDGVRLFGPDGRERWRYGAGASLTPRFARGRVLHVLDHRARRMQALDLATGRPVGGPVPPGRVPLPLP